MDLTCLRIFLWAIYLAAPLIRFLSLAIVSLGLVVARLEKWHGFGALSWSFITATTVGYGDIWPARKTSGSLSVFIALAGILSTGILGAMAVHSATMAFEKHLGMAAV